jgi:hypothetical protein
LAAALWQTPTVADTMGGHLSRGGDRSSELLLRGQAKAVTASLWATPNARDWRSDQGATLAPLERRSLSLDQQTARWATPKTTDARGAGNYGNSPSLTDQTVRSSPLAPPTCPHGAACRPVLNPQFVEWLMGFPCGWTDCTHSATASFRSWQRPLSAPSPLD